MKKLIPWIPIFGWLIVLGTLDSKETYELDSNKNPFHYYGSMFIHSIFILLWFVIWKFV